MEYVFGTVFIDGVELRNLKVSGEEHTDFHGYCTIQREFPDNIITDTFKVIGKYQTDDLADGRKIDWYVIEDYSRYTDKFTPKEPAINEQIADLQELIVDMEYDSIIDELEEE